MKNNYTKYIIITASITSVIFLFLIFLIYVIYCYGYYDKSIYKKIIDNYNSYKFDYIYNQTKQDDEFLTRDIYNNVIDLTYNRNNLLKIYETYYKSMYSEEEFLNKFYYGNKVLKEESFSFTKEGKTTLTKRANIYIDKIYLFNDEDNKTTYGIIKNLSLIINSDSTITLDNEKLTCNKECTIDEIYGGIHSIKYSTNGFTYYGLINVNEDNQKININEVKDLIILEKEGYISPTSTNYNLNTLVPGHYPLKECYLASSCPSGKYSYVNLNEDGTCELYTYITLDQAGDTYNGEYFINNGIITLKFSNHTYTVFDYDTKQKNDIEVETDITYNYKILENNSFINEQYKFQLQE